MRWFRSHSRLGASLALFALAFQLAVSFAHVHLDGFGSGRQPALFGAERIAAATIAPDRSNSGVPAPADEGCAICALIHLAGSLICADAPSLVVASYSVPLHFARATEFDLTRRPIARHRARAPPIA
jgi:hypothetical protein